MALLDQKKFESLANFRNEICVSIFIPTQRAGKEVLEGKNKTHLKSQLDEIKRDLNRKGVSKEKISKITNPIQEIVEDRDFWRHQADGLAIFSSEDFIEKFTLPIAFPPLIHISSEFYIKPIIPLLNNDGRFYLLSITPYDVKFYEASKYSIDEIKVDDLTPERMEDRIGYDYEESGRKDKSQSNLAWGATVHGYNAQNRDYKNEVQRFFRAVDKGLEPILHDKNIPLVVACQDYLFPLYQEATRYKNLFEKPVPGNPSDFDMQNLHEKACILLEPYFEKNKNEKLEKYRELDQTQFTSTSIDEIILAAIDGKIDTLFMNNKDDIWGSIDEKEMKVTVEDEHNDTNTSLMNLAAKKVLENSGNVYFLNSATTPSKESKMSALFRYS